MPIRSVSSGTEFSVSLAEGEGKVLEASDNLTVGAEVSLIDQTVPANTTWILRYAELVFRGLGRWRMTVDGVRVAGGLNSAGREHDRVDLPPGLQAEAGQAVKVLYTYNHGPANLSVDAFVGLVEV